VADARDAIDVLQESKFDRAFELATDLLAKDDRNAQAHLVVALALYKKGMHQFANDMRLLMTDLFRRGRFNQDYLHYSLGKALGAFDEVDKHLKAAARDPNVVFEQCLAQWEIDINRNGRIDQGDQQIFQVELDADGETLPSDDPRRTPTFRFDVGDVYWARAMLSFQRATLSLALAYEIPETQAEHIDETMKDLERGEKPLVIKLRDKTYVHTARDLILDGLSFSDRSRVLYLAEKDDDREWLPNPKQKNHPLPLPMDAQLYETWAGVLSDLKKLVKGDEGIDVAEVAQLGDHQWENPPKGFVDIGTLLEDPQDIVLDFSRLEKLDRNRNGKDVEVILKDMFGRSYRDTMQASALLKKFSRMKDEITRGEESFERKLRYLFWVN
jgi:Tfp pilus assembly protein PilF